MTESLLTDLRHVQKYTINNITNHQSTSSLTNIHMRYIPGEKNTPLSFNGRVCPVFLVDQNRRKRPNETETCMSYKNVSLDKNASNISKPKKVKATMTNIFIAGTIIPAGQTSARRSINNGSKKENYP